MEVEGLHLWRDGLSGQSSSRSGFQSYRRHNSYSSESSNSVYGDLPMAFSGRSNGNCEKMTRQDYENLEKLVLKYFDKKFYFKPPIQNWTLPEPSKMFTADRWKVSADKLKYRNPVLVEG
jgi:hypothetical protein